ncbi:hypothetical protein HDU98_008326 [Podochytrium sp. JEL0797]|nr:hypothetical protein HDU98_008326 [Podochytrium sp. JEL0797]
MPLHAALLSATYIGLGGWCLVHPPSVVNLCFVNTLPEPTGRFDLALRCFGAQACLVGTMWAVTKPKGRYTYAVWAAAMVPFIVFDAMAYQYGMLTFFGFAVDLVGNLVQMGICYSAWRKFSPSDAANGGKKA